MFHKDQTDLTLELTCTNCRLQCHYKRDYPHGWRYDGCDKFGHQMRDCPEVWQDEHVSDTDEDDTFVAASDRPTISESD